MRTQLGWTSTRLRTGRLQVRLLPCAQKREYGWQPSQVGRPNSQLPMLSQLDWTSSSLRRSRLGVRVTPRALMSSTTDWTVTGLLSRRCGFESRRGRFTAGRTGCPRKVHTLSIRVRLSALQPMLPSSPGGGICLTSRPGWVRVPRGVPRRTGSPIGRRQRSQKPCSVGSNPTRCTA